MQTINGVNYLTADEALERHLITQEQYERWIYVRRNQKLRDSVVQRVINDHLGSLL